MGNSIPKDVQDAFYRVVHDFGVEKLAGMMGMSAGVLYNKANTNDTSHHKPTLADSVIVTNLTRDFRILQAFAHSSGGVFHQFPDLSDISTDALLIHIIRIEKEGGDFYRELHGALREDDTISKTEFASIEREAHEWISAILEGLARLKEMAK
ncbi:MAG: phage regulatory CII family protein [Gallionella sp.]|jgi:hypothetical protein